MSRMELRDRRVVVIGLGQSGLAAARLCRARGAHVVGVDAAPQPGTLEALRTMGVDVRVANVDAREALDADCVVVSPGVPRLPVLLECEARGIEVIGELELGCRFLETPVLAVGGTNGKSTTTKLAAEMWKASGARVFVGGNYGTPVCDAVTGVFDIAVLEVSSFQLERAPSFRPRSSILLNITEDHLDRYENLQEYADAKGNAFVNQRDGDTAVVELGDAACLAQARRGKGRLLSYGTRDAGSSPGARLDYAVEGTNLVEAATGNRVDLTRTELHGRHNWLNAAAAVAAVRSFELSWEAISSALRRFEPLAHRMSRVATKDDVTFYDDSKGTNVGAAVTALLGLRESKAVLIAGGRDKQGSYEPLVGALKARGRALVVLGEAAERIESAAAGALPIVRVTSMEAAVRAAYDLARPGDAVLLSPACSSFDMYRSYAHRGDHFQELVRALA
jgi:UDP-N-acetylmuramoylalanine--D-glutamate ligase